MQFWMSIIGMLFGILLGLSIALIVTVNRVKSTNDLGNSEGHFEDFGNRIHVIRQVDDIANIAKFEKGNK